MSGSVLLPGVPLGRKGITLSPADYPKGFRKVRFPATTDTAASYRTCDPLLAGARYGPVLQTQELCGHMTNEGARRAALRECAVRPRSAQNAVAGRPECSILDAGLGRRMRVGRR